MEIAKEGSQFVYLSVALINYFFRAGNSYCSQVFLKEFKYILEKKDVRVYH